MKIRTADLTGAALDWMVGVALGYELNLYGVDPSIRARVPGLGVHAPWSPRQYWNQGGPIKEREGIATRRSNGSWYAMLSSDLGDGERAQWSEYTWRGVATGAKRRLCRFKGDTELIAAMRCLVASRLGDEVDVPEELT